MNTRLKELMLEAGYAAPEMAGRGQKLVELIVRECADVITSMDHSSQYFPHVADAIKQHFGVGE
jgi:hypothetical protein